MSKMMNVPDDLITGKDLDYLSDMFQWNYIAYKKGCCDIKSISDKEITDLINEANELFSCNLETILSIISNPGGDLDE